MTDTPLPPLLDQLAQVAKALRAAQEVLAVGGMPSLAGLDQRLAELCLQVEAVKGPERKAYLGELNGILEVLDACKLGLKHWHATTIARSGKA